MIKAKSRRWLATAYTLLMAMMLASAVLLAPPPMLEGAISAWRPIKFDQHGPVFAILQFLPLLVGLCGLAAGVLHWRKADVPPVHLPAPAGTHAQAPPSAGSSDSREAQFELQAMLAEERRELAALREAWGNASHEAMVVGARLAGAAMDAEARLSASVARAEHVLHHQQAGALEAASITLATVADAAVNKCETALSQAAGEIQGLGEVAAGLRRNAVALEAAGREIALAGAGVIARMGEAATEISAVAVSFPAAVSPITAIAEAAARTMTGSQEGLSAEAARLEAAGREIASAGAGVLARMDEVATEISAAAVSFPAALSSIAAAAEDAAKATTDSQKGLSAEAARLGAAGREMASAGAGVIARMDEVATEISAAAVSFPAALSSIAAAAEDAANATTDSQKGLSAEAARLETAGREMASAGTRVIARMDETAGEISAAAAAFPAAMSSMTAAAGDAARAITGSQEGLFVETAKLEALVAEVRDTALSSRCDLAQLFEVAERMQTSGASHAAAFDQAARAAENLASTIECLRQQVGTAAEHMERTERLIAGLHDEAAALRTVAGPAEAMNTAADTLQREATALTIAAKHISGLGAQTAEAVTASAARWEAASGAVEAASRVIEDASMRPSPMDHHLLEALDHWDRQIAALPAVAAQIADVAVRLRPAEATPGAVPQTSGSPQLAERIDAVVTRLDRLPDMIETIGSAVRTLQTATSAQDAAEHKLADAMLRVEGAAEAAMQAASIIGVTVQTVNEPQSLAGTLQQLEAVDRESTALRERSEALAKAVLSGTAGDISQLLSAQAPALLEKVEASIGRLRSAATALALASDGPRSAGGERRRA